MAEIVVETVSLRRTFGTLVAVDNLDLKVEKQQFYGFLGPNGAGKSTTVKILIGPLDPSEGQVLWNGRSVSEDLPAFQRRLGYVPEEPHLYPHLSGREYLQLAGRLRGIPRAILEPKIDLFLRLFSLWDDRDSPVTSYSKGMRQKILLSAGLLHNPDVLILDEPMSGLDVSAALVFRDLLKKLAAQEGVLAGSSSGAAVFAALKVAKKLGAGKRVVTIIPDSAERYLSKKIFEGGI